MAKSREQLESAINETKYFSIAADNTEALRKSELYKLSAMVFDYCNRFVYARGGKASAYAEEIYKCTINCLNSFNPEKGTPFLNYLNAALSKSIKKAEFREKKTIRTLGQDNIQTESGEGNSLIDMQPSSFPNPEEETIKREMALAGLKAIEEVFKNKQERVKPYLKKLVTREYFDMIIHFHRAYSFIDVEMVKNVYFNKGALPTQKEIAEVFGRLEADASRTINKFNREVKDKLEKC